MAARQDDLVKPIATRPTDFNLCAFEREYSIEAARPPGLYLIVLCCSRLPLAMLAHRG
jgi:hypothetical protein